MKQLLKETTVNEVASLAMLKRARKNKNRVVVFLPPHRFPPIKPFERTRVKTVYGEAVMYAKPHPEAGWLITVEFVEQEGFALKDVAKLS